MMPMMKAPLRFQIIRMPVKMSPPRESQGQTGPKGAVGVQEGGRRR